MIGRKEGEEVEKGRGRNGGHQPSTHHHPLSLLHFRNSREHSVQGKEEGKREHQGKQAERKQGRKEVSLGSRSRMSAVTLLPFLRIVEGSQEGETCMVSEKLCVFSVPGPHKAPYSLYNTHTLTAEW